MFANGTQLSAPKIVLRPPLSVLLIGATGTALFSFFAVVSNLVPNPTTTVGTTVCFLSFALLGVLLVVEYVMGRHELDTRGIRSRGFFGQIKSAAWNDISRIGFNQSLQWFHLRTKDGRLWHITAMLVGLPAFGKLILAHVNPEAIDDDVKTMLRELDNASNLSTRQ
jgi:lipid-A-disaccharide synthase-like uncharacterized protein